eukprot:TRINITY_DN6447_c0_g1_i1.p1 TRINITY_DN6447_c0_g1~~TRINITY_DN6447_c0_g1_i1.p1  ORF type:complete len:1121 (-),score=248.96 TRINITY_DN6447_c0_g1_i1:57-3023(-)
MAAAGISENLDGRLKKSSSKGSKDKDTAMRKESGGSKGSHEEARKSRRADSDSDSDSEDDEKGEEKNLAAHNQERAEELMRKIDFFQFLEATSKGIIKKLAECVSFRTEKRDQVIFRQNDPAGAAWVVVSGTVGVCLWRGDGTDSEKCPTPRNMYNPQEYLTLQQVETRKQERERKAAMKASMNEHVEEQAEPQSPTFSQKTRARSRWQTAGKKALNASTLLQVTREKSASKSSSKSVEKHKQEEVAVAQEDAKKMNKWRGSRSEIFSFVRMQGGKKQAAAGAAVQGHKPQQHTGLEEAEHSDASKKKKKKKGFQSAVGKILAANREHKVALGAGGSAVGEEASPLSGGSDELRSPSSPSSPCSKGVLPDVTGNVMEIETENDDPEAAMRRMEEESGAARYKTSDNFSTFTKESVLGTQVAQLDSGSLFGELALQNSKLRAASIVCLEDAEFMIITPDVYNKVMRQIMDKAQTAKQSKEILKGTKFCKGLEASSPGITNELAIECKVHKEREHQVLFRQGDPPGDCYVVAEGSIDIFIFKEVDALGRKVRARDFPTPRSEDDPTRLKTINQEYEHFKKTFETQEARKNPGNVSEFEVWGKAARYSTTEGNSAFGEVSKYGEKVATLSRGAVVGELALQNNKPRAATVRCSTDCVFLVLSKDVFQRVLGALVDKMRFFNANLPGLSKLQYRENHPSILFHRRIFPAGYKFLFEGIFAIEPALFLLFSGSVEFRRFRNSTDNFAYSQGHKPLMDSKPLDQVLGGLSPRAAAAAATGLQEGSNRASLQSPTIAGRRNAIMELPPGIEHLHERLKMGIEAAPAEGLGGHQLDVTTAPLSRTEKNVAGPTAWTRPASRSSSQVTCGVSGDADVFCTMPFLPMALAEPFTVVAASNVEAYHIGGSDCDKLPPKLHMELRKHLVQKMDATLRRWLAMRERLQIRSPSPQGIESKQASTWPSLWQKREKEIPASTFVAEVLWNSIPFEKPATSNPA